MLRLGDRQIKIPLKLLAAVIIMGMDHPRVGRVGDGIVILQNGSPGKNHVLIKNCPVDKPALKPKFLPVVRAADIGGEKCLDSQPPQIRLCLDAALFRVVEASRILLSQGAVVAGKLPGVCHDHRLSLRTSL